MTTTEASRRPFLTVKSAAQYLGLSYHTIYAYTEAGTLPHYKLGGRIRFDPDQLDEWLEERHVPVSQ